MASGASDERLPHWIRVTRIVANSRRGWTSPEWMNGAGDLWLEALQIRCSCARTLTCIARGRRRRAVARAGAGVSPPARRCRPGRGRPTRGRAPPGRRDPSRRLTIRRSIRAPPAQTRSSTRPGPVARPAEHHPRGGPRHHPRPCGDDVRRTARPPRIASRPWRAVERAAIEPGEEVAPVATGERARPLSGHGAAIVAPAAIRAARAARIRSIAGRAAGLDEHAGTGRRGPQPADHGLEIVGGQLPEEVGRGDEVGRFERVVVGRGSRAPRGRRQGRRGVAVRGEPAPDGDHRRLAIHEHGPRDRRPDGERRPARRPRAGADVKKRPRCEPGQCRGRFGQRASRSGERRGGAGDRVGRRIALVADRGRGGAVTSAVLRRERGGPFGKICGGPDGPCDRGGQRASRSRRGRSVRWWAPPAARRPKAM